MGGFGGRTEKGEMMQLYDNLKNKEKVKRHRLRHARLLKFV